jgi:hypothetical protein
VVRLLDMSYLVDEGYDILIRTICRICDFPMILENGRRVKSCAAFVHERLCDDRRWLLPHIVMAEFQHSHLQNLITVAICPSQWLYILTMYDRRSVTRV